MDCGVSHVAIELKVSWYLNTPNAFMHDLMLSAPIFKHGSIISAILLHHLQTEHADED